MSTDFYEDDEPVADVIAAYERGVKGVTRRPVPALADEFAELDMTEAEFDAAMADGQPVRVVGHAVKDVILSVRVDPATAEALRRRGSVSALLRSAAERLTAPVGFTCPHVTMTAGGGFGGARLLSVTSGCGCAMTPMFATT